MPFAAAFAGHNQEAGSEEENPGLEWAPIWDAYTAGGSPAPDAMAPAQQQLL